jgi:hypothetical protein
MSRRTNPRASKSTRRKRIFEFGAPSADDNPSAQANQPSSSALSTRYIRDPDVPLPALTTLATRVIAHNFKRLTREDNVESTLEQLKELPESLIPKLFALLKETYPSLLSHAVISAVRGYISCLQYISLSVELPSWKQCQPRRQRRCKEGDTVSDIPFHGRQPDVIANQRYICSIRQGVCYHDKQATKSREVEPTVRKRT